MLNWSYLTYNHPYGIKQGLNPGRGSSATLEFLGPGNEEDPEASRHANQQEVTQTGTQDDEPAPAPI